MPIQHRDTKHAWWTDVRHGGMLISPVVLDEVFPDGPAEPPFYSYNQLRDRYNTFETWLKKNGLPQKGEVAPLHNWLDAVLEKFLGHEPGSWRKGPNVTDNFTYSSPHGDLLRPNRVLLLNGDPVQAAFIVMVDRSKRIGIGKGRTTYSRLLELMRARNIKLGLLTNGSQFRLVHAALDSDSWVEWEAEAWFEEGETRRQLNGFFTLLGLSGITPRDDISFPLIHSVESSRTRQGELSTVLGEQVRQAVERLLQDIDNAYRKNKDFLEPVYNDPDSGPLLSQKEVLSALYQASTRIVMRMVVILFAEARGLLPRNLETYNSSYGIEGLFSELTKVHSSEGFRAMEDRFGAWPRLLSLFNILYFGSAHPQVPVPVYGGMLFQPGDPNSPDPVFRALSLFRSSDYEISDRSILKVLRLLKIGKLKIRRGRSSATVSGPVDFSDLRTEYIGIMYEGLLDFELKQTPDPMVFLNLGPEPILPIGVLEQMEDKDLKKLLQELKKEKTTALASDDESSDDESNEEDLEEDIDAETTEEELDIEAEDSGENELENIEAEADEEPLLSETEQEKNRVHEWALRAVEVAGFVKKPSGKNPNLYQYENDRQKAARNLISRVLSKGELYLVSSGGTRKGSGTFYTKPQLAVPTVHRTLKPLLFEDASNGSSKPRKPEEILSLKICDPACGSGSFLVSALNYINEALYQSIFSHGNFKEKSDSTRADAPPTKTVITLPFGKTSEGGIQEEVVPHPLEDDRFEPYVRARLKRYVVERCIYGVDLNPMAVELAKLSLWIETMDKELPFGFLDHKVKCGNSLVGCWFDRFKHYPALAWWDREGGDKSHSNGFHFKKGELTQKINDIKSNVISKEIFAFIDMIGVQGRLEFGDENESADDLHEKARSLFEKLHSLPVTGDGVRQREQLYRDEILDNPALLRIKEAFDKWCAVWFWPVDDAKEDGTGVLSPLSFLNPSEEIMSTVRHLASEHKFFHWELEFPDVFASENSGFNATVGNPPWEIMKPNSKEFFFDYDPVYRTYGKQDALRHQTRLFEADKNIELSWLRYNAFFKSMSNFVKKSINPFDSKPGASKHKKDIQGKWEVMVEKETGYADPKHPYMHQGSADLNTYKMFLELSHSIIRNSGRIGMIVPSGIYTDKGCLELRKLFLERCSWDYLIGFINWKRIFNIYYRFKFCVIHVEKGILTKMVKSAFNRFEVKDIEHADDLVIQIPFEKIKSFSTKNYALLEITSSNDLAITEKIFYDKSLLGNCEGIDVKYGSEFHMTNDSKYFSPISKWTTLNYQADIYGRWLKGKWEKRKNIKEKAKDGEICSFDNMQTIASDEIEDIALPVFEGRMIDQFNYSQKGWVKGKGRGAVWRDIGFYDKCIEPQYLMGQNDYAQFNSSILKPKIVIVGIASATNRRSMKSTYLSLYPCGNVVPIITQADDNALKLLFLSGIFNSFTLDYILRERLGSGVMFLGWHILEELPIPIKGISKTVFETIVLITAQLSLIGEQYSCEWVTLCDSILILNKKNMHVKSIWAVTEHERTRLRSVLDAIVADIYGIDFSDYKWIMREDRNDPKGFWRVDDNKAYEIRTTMLSIAALRDLQEMGLEEFCKLNDGDGWQIPEKLSFKMGSDGVIDFTEQGTEPVPVRDRLGPRFLPWQTEGTVEDSWEECRIHARNICGPSMKRDFGKNDSAPPGDGNNNSTIKENEYNRTSKSKNAFELKSERRKSQGDLFEE